MYIILDTEGGMQLLKMSAKDAAQCKRLLDKGQEEGDWPDGVNDIIDRAEVIKAPTLNSTGDCWGWYEPEDEG